MKITGMIFICLLLSFYGRPTIADGNIVHRLIMNEMEKNNSITEQQVTHSALEYFFPHWRFYKLTWVMSNGGKYSPPTRVAVGRDDSVIFIDHPSVTQPMPKLLALSTNSKIRISNKNEAILFGTVVNVIYRFGRNFQPDAKQIDEDTWVIHLGKRFRNNIGLLVDVDADGLIKNIVYDLKMEAR